MSSPEFRKTLLIGLGGAGQEIVLRTKRLFLDTYGRVPPCVKLLSLDTDASQKMLLSADGSQQHRFEPEEFLHLNVEQPAVFLKHSEEVKAWHEPRVYIGAITNGAGAVRQTGRLAFFYHFNELKPRFSRLIESFQYPGLFNEMSEAGFKLSERPPEIYVCGSLAGGTGSGTFLDAAVLLRYLQPNALINGVFLLAWPYRYKAFAHRTQGNAYAALTELDTLQTIIFDKKKKAHPHRIKYAAHTEVEVNQAPYDIVHLVDGRDEYGNHKGEVQEICDNVADAVFLSMGTLSYPVTSAVDNLLTAINSGNSQLWEGRFPRYSSFGVSSIHYPAKELHGVAAARNAVQLVNSAIASLSDGAAEPPAADTDSSVVAFILRENLTREHARAELGPDQGHIELTVEPHEVNDPLFPEALKSRFTSEQRALEVRNTRHLQATGEAFISDKVQALANKLKAIAADPMTDMAYRFNWSSAMANARQELADAIARELQQVEEDIDNLKRDTEGRLAHAKEVKYLPIVYSLARKSAAGEWAKQASKQLEAMRKKLGLENEQALFTRLLALLNHETTLVVPRVDDIHQALARAKVTLEEQCARAGRVLANLKNRPNHVLLGGGSHYVIAGEDGKPAGGAVEQLFLSYADFIQQQQIHHAQVYLDQDRNGPGHLSQLFLKACAEHLDTQYQISRFSAEQALESLAAEAEDPEAFKRQQFSRLFLLAGSMWNYERSLITADRGEHLQNIFNLGFNDNKAGEQAYKNYVNAACNTLHVINEPNYSTTGDPSRIWLLNFSAVLPAYFMTGLKEAKRNYDNEITPSYHADQHLEMVAADLFPERDSDNQALRVLAMAIIPGIAVITDEKQPKGHKFTFRHGAINKTWDLFRDLYDEVRETYVKGRTDNLLTLLSDRLKAQVTAIPPDQLKTCIREYLQKAKAKLDSRDFSRLYSARLTYRELTELALFLEEKLDGSRLEEPGYGMQIDLYIKGERRIEATPFDLYATEERRTEAAP